MRAEIGKYYIVHKEGNIIVDIGLTEKEITISTLKQIFVSDNENDYLVFKSTLKGVSDELQ